MVIIFKHFLLIDGDVYVTASNEKVHLSILCDQKVFDCTILLQYM